MSVTLSETEAECLAKVLQAVLFNTECKNSLLNSQMCDLCGHKKGCFEFDMKKGFYTKYKHSFYTALKSLQKQTGVFFGEL